MEKVKAINLLLASILISPCRILHFECFPCAVSITGDCLWSVSCTSPTSPAHDDQAVLAHSQDTGAPSLLCESEGQRDPASLLHTPLEAAPLCIWVPCSSTQSVVCLDMDSSLIRECGQLTRGVLPWEKYLRRLLCRIASGDQDGLWNGKVCTFQNLSA